MSKIIILFTILMSFPITSLAEEPTIGPLHSIELHEFMELPENFQVMYVAGAIDGMTFVSYGYGLKDHDELVSCYRSLPLGQFTAKVVEFAKSKKDFKENIATLVAMTAGNMCKK